MRRHVTIGFLGHEGHGASALLRTLLGLLNVEVPDQDRLKILDLSYYTAETKARLLSLYFTPGARSNLKNIARMCGLIDAAVLVVSAQDGVMPQTREHILVAAAAGLHSIAVFIDGCDQIEDEELLDLVELEVRSLLSDAGLDGDVTPVIRGATQANEPDLWAPALQSMLEVLDRRLEPPIADPEGPLSVQIDRAFPSKAGCVVRARILRGTLRVQGRPWIFGFGLRKQITVSRIELERESIEAAPALGVYGLQLQGVKPEQIKRGQVLCEQGDPLSMNLSVEVQLPAPTLGGRAKPIFKGYQASFFIRNSTVTGRFVEVPSEMIAPDSETKDVRIMLDAPTPIADVERLCFRDGSDPQVAQLGLPIRWGGFAGWAKIQKAHPGYPGADLSGRDLKDIPLSRSNLSGARLTKVDLTGADLQGTNFSGANLGQAKLEASDLSYADLTEANLNSANLRNAKLRLANLRGANLNETDLRGAELKSARFRYDQLIRARGVPKATEPSVTPSGYACPICGARFWYYGRPGATCYSCGWRSS